MLPAAVALIPPSEVYFLLPVEDVGKFFFGIMVFVVDNEP
jgi:hypothetical protein